MKRVIFALVLSMSLISAIAGFSEQIATTKASTDPLEVGVVTEGCQLAVHAVKQKPQQEQPIKLIIVRSNVSDNDMSFSARMPQYDYHFDIKDAQGKNVPLTEYGKKVEANRENVYKCTVYTLKPGELKDFDFDLSDAYELSTPGTYSVTIFTSTPKLYEQGIAKLVANTIKIVVPQPKVN